MKSNKAAPFAVYQPIDRKTDNLLTRLAGVKKIGSSKWKASPAHADHTPSLYISQIDDRILIRCFAGCGYVDVLAAIGLDASSLFLDEITNPYEKKLHAPRFNKAELFDLVVQEAGILALAWNDLLVNSSVSETDYERTQSAYNTVLDLLCEAMR